MIRYFYRHRKRIALFFAALHVIQIFGVQQAHALTGGPSQPEAQGFQPAGTTDMVDLFTGDFGYNIPLFELPGPNGGYPFNLSYQSGIGMDQEASWVGLGWSLNPGTINRQMRGLPDEFSGDPIYTKMSRDPSVTVGLGAGVSVELFGGDAVSLGLGFSVSQNNYTGFGYSIDGSIGFQKAAGDGGTAGIGLDLSLNSKEGVSVNPSLSLGQGISLAAGYNSKEGLQTISVTQTVAVGSSKGAESDREHKFGSASVSSSISLAHPGYTPQVSMPMENTSISASFKLGAAWWGVFGSPYVTGFYNEQRLKNDKRRVRSDAYGYLNYEKGSNPGAVQDFNREKDGVVTKVSPNLAIPFMTYDIYSVTGQGISAMYRPMRNDYGILRDPQTSSSSVGGSVGVDVGPGVSHIGANLRINHSRSVSGGWNDDNTMDSHAVFQKKNIDDAYEPWYFKVHGEPAVESVSQLNALGETSPVRVQLTGNNSSASATNKLEKGRTGWSDVMPAANRDRKPRAQTIQPLTNEQLTSAGQEMLSQFKVRYLNNGGVETAFNRSNLPAHHIACFTALTPQGLRYNYGIPAYNLSQEEITFSARKQTGQTSKVNVGNGGQGDPTYQHANTEKFLKRVELPEYAHSYLLTSIIGPDYVDVTRDGVSEDDLGYWVKFTYKKTATDADRYKWRDPYSKAHFQEGWKTDPRDDKGYFVYGEKELWYLARAETKSHIAVFSTEERQDGRGVSTKLQDSDLKGKAVHALKEIKLFTRSAGSAAPIKVVKFEYDYSLCKGIFNSSTTNGKLTLKKLWFEYGHSQRGSLNPYVFAYHSNNPNYDQHAYDRWGNYKPYPAGDYLHNVDFPYVNQDPDAKVQLDSNVAAWSLKEIQLPSGGKVLVDYEVDDYGYVQHLQAMQMTEIVDPYADASAAPASGEFTLSDDTRIRFKLERPIAGTLSEAGQKAEVLKYLDQKRKQLYFKVQVNLRSASEDFFEYISGYADIDFTKAMTLEKDASGEYVYGTFLLAKEDGSHPFSMRTWQHLRTNQPDLANSGRVLKKTSSTNERVNQIKSLGSIGTQIRQMFEGFNDYCYGKGWGREIVAGKSWVRLNSPDRIKYGGGSRVRQITMKDSWQQDEEGVYGQVYEYTTEEGGDVISSGVAAYEPIIGGDENPHRYAKKYVQSVPLRSPNNLFFEYPVNESSYPGPQVGYSKVTVTSLASAHLAGKQVGNITLSDGQPLFPSGEGVTYGTTGMTVHEFYTARDFPVIAEETEKTNKPYSLAFPVPFLGNIAMSKLTTSQGYSIVTNDMHGKPREIRNYRQDKTGKVEPEAISWVKYNYSDTTSYYQQEKVRLPLNQFKDNGDGTLSLLNAQEMEESSLPKYTLGQENEFFIDMRQFEDKTWGGGGSFNTDFIFFFFGAAPVPMAWPNVSRSTTQLRTAVANKIIFKSGILESTEAFDGGSRVITKNLKWDKLTGVPVLTVVNNNFDEPVYSYAVPAYTKYQGMGAAYQNIGLSFSINNVDNLPYHDNFYQFTAAMASSLFPGDEILLYPNEGEDLKNPIAKVVYTGEESGDKLLYSDVSLTATAYKAMIVRSGYRNQLEVMAGNITALDDPSRQGTPVVHSKVITIPSEE